MGSEVKFNVILRLLTNENIILFLKLQDSGLEICLDMFEGEGLISILKIWV